MGVANFPFPSFTLLLTLDRVVIPGPSYVFKLAPLSDNDVNVDLIEAQECYPLVNLDFDDDSTTDVGLGHCDPEEFTDDVTETISTSTGSVRQTISGSRRAKGKLRFPFLKSRPTAHFRLKSIFKHFD